MELHDDRLIAASVRPRDKTASKSAAMRGWGLGLARAAATQHARRMRGFAHWAESGKCPLHSRVPPWAAAQTAAINRALLSFRFLLVQAVHLILGSKLHHEAISEDCKARSFQDLGKEVGKIVFCVDLDSLG